MTAQQRVPITIRLRPEAVAMMRDSASTARLSLSEYVRQVLAHAYKTGFKPTPGGTL